MWRANEAGSGHSALAILSHDENRDAPQGMRVWPPETNNGAIFLNYVPIQEYAWAIAPGRISEMRYRLVVSDGQPDANDLNRRWERFTDLRAGLQAQLRLAAYPFNQEFPVAGLPKTSERRSSISL